MLSVKWNKILVNWYTLCATIKSNVLTKIDSPEHYLGVQKTLTLIELREV